MTSDEIIDALSRHTGKFPRKALLEAPQHREELTPQLLSALDNLYENAERIMKEDPEYDLAFYAYFLLAQFREKQAFPRMIRLLKLNADILDFFLGDLLMDGYNKCLCGVYDGNLELIKEIIEDSALNEYARSAALDTWGLLFREGQISREELCEYLRFLMRRLSNERGYIPNTIVNVVADEHLFELIDEVKAFYKHNTIDYQAIGNYDSFINRMFNYRRFNENKKTRVDDVVKELESWAKYKEEPKPPPAPKKTTTPRKNTLPAEPPAQKKKIGRNDPCPCGSGKKYKKCCLLKNNVSLNAPLPLPSREESDEADNEYYKEYDENTGNGQIDSFRALRKIVSALAPELVDADDEPYNLLSGYPALDAADARRKAEELAKDDNYCGDAQWMPPNPRYITEFYSKKAIEMDIPVYKALHHRAIPLWVRRDYKKEYFEKISLLGEAFEMFTQTCAEEGIKSFAEFDAKYMVHYEAAHWLGRLGSLLDGHKEPLSPSDSALKDKVKDVIKQMS
jgi:hypothetical protein